MDLQTLNSIALKCQWAVSVGACYSGSMSEMRYDPGKEFGMEIGIDINQWLKHLEQLIVESSTSVTWNVTFRHAYPSVGSSVKAKLDQHRVGNFYILSGQMFFLDYRLRLWSLTAIQSSCPRCDASACSLECFHFILQVHVIASRGVSARVWEGDYGVMTSAGVRAEPEKTFRHSNPYSGPSQTHTHTHAFLT